MKIRRIFLALLFLPVSIYFNFKYLPFKQAIKLPILLCRPRLISMRGKVVIKAGAIRIGMIRLGFMNVPIYPNKRIIWQNCGEIIFEGDCCIGNNSAVSCGKTGKIVFGNNFAASTTLKIVSNHLICFKENVCFGFENSVFDSDFHKLTSQDKNNKEHIPYKPIIIGSNNWFGVKCLILKGSQTPDYCTIGAYSLLNKKIDVPPYSIIGGNPVILKKTGYFRDTNNDDIKYESCEMC